MATQAETAASIFLGLVLHVYGDDAEDFDMHRFSAHLNYWRTDLPELLEKLDLIEKIGTVELTSGLAVQETSPVWSPTEKAYKLAKTLLGNAAEFLETKTGITAAE